MTNLPLEARRAVVRTKPGETGSVSTGKFHPPEFERALVDFARKRNNPIRVISNDQRVITFERLHSTAGQMAPRLDYAPMDALQVGESYLFDIPPAQFTRVRMSASVRNRSGNVLFSCSAEPGGIRVTRHELGSETKRTSKWGLDRLETEPRITVTLDEPKQRQALSVAVHAFSIRRGWRLTTRSLPDGTVLIFRTDLPEPPPTPTPTTD